MNKLLIPLQKTLFILLGFFIPTSIAITNLIIGLLALCWIIEGNFKPKIQIIKTSKWMLSLFALIFLYALGMLWGENHLNAEWQFQRLALLFVFPLLATIKIDQKSISYAISAFLFTTFVSALLAILVNNNIISPLSEYLPIIRGGEAFIKYNYHNILLALSFTLSLYLIIENQTKHKKVLILFILVYAISIFTEKGRAGQVIFNFSALFYIFYYNRSNIFRAVFFFTLLFGFQFLVYATTGVYKSRINYVSKTIQTKGGEDKKDIRYLWAKESLNKISEKPFLGYGTGSFGTILKSEVDEQTQSQYPYWSDYFNKHVTPHNQYLYVWFELGILGLVLLVLIFYYQIRELLKRKDGIHRILLPISFLFLMLVDSYLFIFTLTIAYIFLYTVYSRYESK